MSLKIRLSRGGAKKRPFYRIVVADVRAPRDGRYVERVGTYNPMLPKESGERVALKEDRVRHWLAQGAKPTDRVLRFLAEAGILERAPRSNPQKALPGKKAQERIDAAKQAEEDAKQAAADAAEAEAAEAAEAPETVEETVEAASAE